MSPFLEKAAESGLKQLARVIIAKLLPSKLTQDLDKEVSVWIESLPAKLKNVAKDSILKGLQPGSRAHDSDEEIECWVPVLEALCNNRIPTNEMWRDGLRNRFELVRRQHEQGSAEAIFELDAAELNPLLSRLAQRLKDACAKQEDLFRTDVHRQLTSIQKTSTKILNQVTVAVPDGTGNGHYEQIDIAKELFEKHNQSAASAVIDKLKEPKAWDKMSTAQRYRVEALRANILIKEGQFHDAAKVLLKAKSLQPNEEKARVNEAVGYELLEQSDDAHRLAHKLTTDYPHSGRAWSAWIRTSPVTKQSADVENKVPSHLLDEAEVCIALATIFLREGAFEKGLEYARKGCDVASEWPAAWLTQGQALHQKGVEYKTSS